MNDTLLETARNHYRAGRFDEALRALDNATRLYPGKAELWNNRGTVLAAMNMIDEARQSFERALSLKPDFTGALGNRANILLALGRFEEAARDYEKVLIANPGFPYGYGNLLHCRLQYCDWRMLDKELERMIAGVRAGARVASPLAITTLLRSPEDQLRAARILANDKYPPSPSPIWRGERYAHERIRLAYLSADFYAHATATLLVGVLERHDKTHVETIGVSFGRDDGSSMRARVESAFEHFIDATSRNDAGIAALMREMEIDIAVDLKGYTSNARPGIFAKRLAPVQVNYLGYPGTMAAAYMDYILADPVVIPKDTERFYQEKIVRLPDCYQPNDAKRRIDDHTPTRAAAGLPDKGFVFCSFNNSYKIMPEMFYLWMRLLSAIDGSVLWLLEDNVLAARNLQRMAERHGIAASRLVFAPRAKPEEHLARHRLADLFLDTLPYNAHTTASDALWAGLPVLTCPGETFASRVAASLLQALGLHDLIVDSLGDYEARARNLAHNPDALAAIKIKLARNAKTHPLFDTARYTRHLEAAFIRMHEQAQRSEKPTSFSVPPISALAPD